MRISLIVAADEDGVIGRAGELPWRLSADLKRFKQLTLGHHLVMGRKTFESIGRVLPGRTSIVISRQPDLPLPEGCRLARNLDAALAIAEAAGDAEAFIIGGGEIFEQALPQAERIYLTAVHVQVAGDVRFPPFNLKEWTLVEDVRQAADLKNEYDHSFRVLDRKPS